MFKFFRGFLILFGATCILFSGYLFWIQNKPNKYKLGSLETSYGSPITQLSHLSYGDVVLPITSSRIENGKWPLEDDSVVYLQDSAAPGETGNTIIYGHNWSNLLGFLKNVKVGQQIKLTDSSNRDFLYKIELIQEVSPDQTHILSDSQDSRLTLYTCSGFLDSKRLVVVAKRL